MCGIQHTVCTIVGERVSMALAVGCPVHGCYVSIKAGCTVVIGQRLTELCIANSCHPSMQIVAIALLVVAIATAVQFLIGKAAEFIVTISSKGNSSATIQLVCHLCWACTAVVGIGQLLGARYKI